MHDSENRHGDARDRTRVLLFRLDKLWNWNWRHVKQIVWHVCSLSMHNGSGGKAYFKDFFSISWRQNWQLVSIVRIFTFAIKRGGKNCQLQIEKKNWHSSNLFIEVRIKSYIMIWLVNFTLNFTSNSESCRFKFDLRKKEISRCGKSIYNF